MSDSSVKFLKEVPSNKGSGHCDKHGAYEYRYQTVLDVVYCSESCGECASEKQELERKVERENKAHAIKQRGYEARTAAGISKRNLGKGFDFLTENTAAQTKAKQQCKAFADRLKAGETDCALIMCGGVGTGKTLAASAIIDDVISGLSCRIIKAVDMIREIKASWSDKTKPTDEQVIKDFIGYDLLVIDEVGVQFGTEAERLLLFDVIDGRYQDMKPIVLISNLDIEGVKQAVGERIIDRLREGESGLAVFDWESHRTKK